MFLSSLLLASTLALQISVLQSFAAFPRQQYNPDQPPVLLKRVRRYTSVFGGFYSTASAACASSSPVYAGYINYLISLSECPLVASFHSQDASPLLARNDGRGCTNKVLTTCMARNVQPDANFGGHLVSTSNPPNRCPTSGAQSFVQVDFSIYQDPTVPIWLSFCYKVIDPTSIIGGFFGQSQTTPIPVSILSVPVNPETGGRSCTSGYVPIPVVDVVSVDTVCDDSPCEYTIFYCHNIRSPYAVDLRGPSGEPGENGYPGPSGSSGSRGSSGVVGSWGQNGISNSVAGPEGQQGSRGPPGSRGDKGNTGDPGCPGRNGRPGLRGRQADSAEFREIIFDLMREFVRPRA